MVFLCLLGWNNIVRNSQGQKENSSAAAAAEPPALPSLTLRRIWTWQVLVWSGQTCTLHTHAHTHARPPTRTLAHTHLQLLPAGGATALPEGGSVRSTCHLQPLTVWLHVSSRCAWSLPCPPASDQYPPSSHPPVPQCEWDASCWVQRGLLAWWQKTHVFNSKAGRAHNSCYYYGLCVSPSPEGEAAAVRLAVIVNVQHEFRRRKRWRMRGRGLKCRRIRRRSTQHTDLLCSRCHVNASAALARRRPCSSAERTCCRRQQWGRGGCFISRPETLIVSLHFPTYSLRQSGFLT